MSETWWMTIAPESIERDGDMKLTWEERRRRFRVDYSVPDRPHVGSVTVWVDKETSLLLARANVRRGRGFGRSWGYENLRKST